MRRARKGGEEVGTPATSRLRNAMGCGVLFTDIRNSVKLGREAGLYLELGKFKPCLKKV